MERETGGMLTDLDHIQQSVRDILLPPVGTRVMHRQYGSLLSTLIDQAQNEELRLQIMSADYRVPLRRSSPHTLSRKNDLAATIRLSALYAAIHVESVQRVNLIKPSADVVLDKRRPLTARVTR
ncbi:hypothetical protein [Pantoea sp. EKM21T]